MKTVLFIVTALFILTGCGSKTKNLTFLEKEKLRITFNCHVPFDAIRQINAYKYKGTIKDTYYVWYKGIQHSYLEHSQTNTQEVSFGLFSYIDFLEDEGAEITYKNIDDNVLYLSYTNNGLTYNQMVAASCNRINIINVEPMMLKTIEKQCAN